MAEYEEIGSTNNSSVAIAIVVLILYLVMLYNFVSYLNSM
jgi:hypothetical protein